MSSSAPTSASTIAAASMAPQKPAIAATLKPTADDKTKVEFRMGNLAGYPPAEVGSVNYTWGQVVGRLKAFVESGRPQPFLE